MPKVGRIEIKWRGYDAAATSYDLYYSSKDGFSVKGLPDEFVQCMSNYRFSHHATEGALRDVIEKSVYEYKEIKQSKRKVIRFSAFATSALTMNRTGPASFEGQKAGISRKLKDFGHSSPDYAIGISYDILYEVDKGGKKYFRVNDDESVGRETRKVSDAAIIDWTPEREFFFKEMIANLQKIAYKLSDFVSGEDSEIALKIDGFSDQKLIG